MTSLDVAVVGAGIGGLTAALALASHGHRITVYERRTGFGEPGAGIQLSPNASRILIELGLGSSLRRVASEPDGIVVRDLRSGRELATSVLGSWAAERFGAPYWFVSRQDLHTSLLDAVRARDAVRLRVGRTLTNLSEREDRVALTFDAAGGAADAAEADLVVAADGVWSRARTSLGDGREPVASGFVAYRATVPAAAVPPALGGNAGGLWLGPGRHVVHYPIAAGRLVNVVAVERGGDGPGRDWSEPVEPGRVLAAFAPSAPLLRELLAAAPQWSGWALHDLPAGRMSAGRVALVGDAAHPTLPFIAQGGAMAVEDAACLAATIARSGDDLPGALRAYAAGRLPRIRRVQDAARRNARTYHASGVVAFARNLVLRRLGPHGLGERYAWIYGWRAGPT